MSDLNDNIDYGRWRNVVTKTQLILIGLVFVIEVANNAILYVTRSQGYGPDTIVEKLLRYLVFTTVFNLVSFAVGQCLVRNSNSKAVQKIALLMSTQLICTNVAFSHYQFSICFASFLIPTLLCILYEDIRLLNLTFVTSLVGLSIAAVARGLDPLFNQDIIPKATIGFAVILASYLVSKIVLQTLKNHSRNLQEALAAVEKAKRQEEMANLTIRMMDTLAQTIDAKDTYTNGHSFRVSLYSVLLARALGYSEEDVETLRRDAILHDIGKINIPDAILNKPGKLTDIEFDVIKAHTVVGTDILKDLAILPFASEVAGQHHERYDGRGYPNGRKGNEIVPFARIVAIADSYDAMSSSRIYRKALDKAKIREQLVGGRGTQFDPHYLDVFLKLFDSGALEAAAEEQGQNRVCSGQTVSKDVECFIETLHQSEPKAGAFKISSSDFRQIFAFTKRLEERYNNSFELIVVSVTPSENSEITDEEIEKSSEAIEVAIRKNIRMVDVYTRFSATYHVVLLTNAGADNVEIIMRRISFDYGRLESSGKFLLNYEFKKDIH